MCRQERAAWVEKNGWAGKEGLGWKGRALKEGSRRVDYRMVGGRWSVGRTVRGQPVARTMGER